MAHLIHAFLCAMSAKAWSVLFDVQQQDRAIRGRSTLYNNDAEAESESHLSRCLPVFCLVAKVSLLLINTLPFLSPRKYLMHDGRPIGSDESCVLRYSVLARLCTIALALVTSLVISPFDTSGALALSQHQLLSSYCSNATSGSSLQKLALPFTQWDTIHFLAIARDGYSDEQKFAFLPGVPGLLALAGRLPYWLGRSEERFSASLAVILVSLVATCLSCSTPVILYRLAFQLSHSKSFSRTTALLYIISPAPAIFSVPYTEPFYAFFAFSGMLYLATTRKAYLKATVCFTIAALFRANGLLNIGFLAWYFFWQMGRFKLSQVLRKSAYFAISSILVATPFIAHQNYAYKTFCIDYTGEPRPWRSRSLPLAYSFVQEHYWDVGFLRYWTLQQLPNFLLAAPVLAMSLGASLVYYRATWPQCLYRSLPFNDVNIDSSRNKAQHPYFKLEMLPFLHLHTILTLILFFESHVQIALRQACTNPVIYWYAAYLVQRGDKRAKWWTGYCLIWGAVSVVLWTSFYPPA